MLTKRWKESFDVSLFQDPSNLDKFNIQKFYHVQKNLKVPDEGRFKGIWGNEGLFQQNETQTLLVEDRFNTVVL